MRASWLTQVLSKSDDRCPCKKQDYRRGGSHVQTETVTGVKLQAKGQKRQQPEETGRIIPWSLLKKTGPATP
jgi:hypothetical protein